MNDILPRLFTFHQLLISYSVILCFCSSSFAVPLFLESFAGQCYFRYIFNALVTVCLLSNQFMSFCNQSIDIDIIVCPIT